MINNNQRKAQPGDFFILLVPSAQELHHLRRWQSELQAQYGGQKVDFLHITCQRFTPHNGQSEESCIKSLFKLFRSRLAAVLSKNNCHSHFNRIRYASCTILNLDEMIDTKVIPPDPFSPVPLFTVRSLLISKLNTEGKFETLETIKL